MFGVGGRDYLVDDEQFFKEFLKAYPRTTPRQTAALGRVLGFLESDTRVMDVRWAAYVLATAKHETWHSFEPIEERGKGRGLRYGEPVRVICDGVERDVVFYGRGYVQITWKDNYEKLGKAIGMGDALVGKPELALDPEIAYKILTVGMCDGLFRRSHMLSRYINNELCDYRNARNIVNGGLDKADDIAKYAATFETALRASLELP